MPNVNLDIAKSLMNISGRLESLINLLKGQESRAYTIRFDGLRCNIVNTATHQVFESATYPYRTFLKGIKVQADRHDDGDAFYIVFGGNEHPSKANPIYCNGRATNVHTGNELEFDGDLPVIPEKEPIKFVFVNGTTQAKIAYVTFKRVVENVKQG